MNHFQTSGNHARDPRHDSSAIYPLPIFLARLVEPEQYRRWLRRKAQAHCRRDRKRLRDPVVLADYKMRIHQAVCASEGFDWYTGELLQWELISKYDNTESQAGRSKYKAGFALLPTVDHVLGANAKYEFVICGWRTNDAKNDLSLADFLELCRRVLAKHGTAGA